MSEIICKYCNKSFKTYQSRSNHYKRYHNNHTILLPQNTQKLNSISQNTTFLPQNTHENYNLSQNTLNLVKTNNCQYCNKKLARYDSVKRHEVICKFKIINEKTEISLKEENQILKDALKKQFEENNEIKLMLTNLLNKNCKIHPKTLQKINKQLNVGDNSIINENTNNGIINNNITYNILALGHENLSEVFSKKEKIAILKYRFCSLPHLVEYTHFNDKYPQFKNILITNTQNNLAYKYDTKKKQFIAINKDELLDDIVDARMCDIHSFYDELENELDDKTKEIIEKVKDKIDNDPAYREIKKKDIKLIIYNNRNKINKQIEV
jgi:hypothetical protein